MVGLEVNLRVRKGLDKDDSLSLFMFNLIVDVLGRLIDKAKDKQEGKERA